MRVGIDLGYQRLLRLRGGYAFVRDGLSGPSVGMGLRSGSIGVDLARAFLTGSDLGAQNPTFFSFRVVFCGARSDTGAATRARTAAGVRRGGRAGDRLRGATARPSPP